MAPLVLEGETLSQKHRHYNKLVKTAVTDQSWILDSISYSDPDVDNLLRIDVACARRDVTYILEVMKSNDLLYVTQTIKRSKWLITEDQYEHIINPHYLEQKMFPSMTTKARSKLICAIQQHMTSEVRVDAFLSYYKDDPQTAKKWLHCCSKASIRFIQEYASIFSVKQIIRLCRKSITILEAYCKQYHATHIKDVLENATNLLRCNCDKYLDIVDYVPHYYKPKFRKKATQIIMNHCRKRVIDHFDDYSDILHTPTFAQNLKSDEIHFFLINQKRNKYLLENWFKFENIKHFLRNILKDKRIQFIKTLFMVDRTSISKDFNNDADHLNLCCLVTPHSKDIFNLKKSVASQAHVYQWYRYFPFDVAISELKRLIDIETSPAERYEMYTVLIKSAGSQQQLQTLLKFYQSYHINEPLKFKMQFINAFLMRSKIHELDTQTWSILNEIFLSMDVYMVAGNEDQCCVKAIIVYKILNDEAIPEVIENKFTFSTLKDYRRKLNENQQKKIFNYLYAYLVKALKSIITNESELTNNVETLHKILNLFTDWKVNINDYPIIINKIKETVNKKLTNGWNVDLSNIYKGKLWRKQLFEESLIMYPSDEAYLNALKHDPGLLLRYRREAEIFLLSNNESIVRVLRKIRIYWADSIAQKWIDFYRLSVEQSNDENSVKCIFILMPCHRVLPIIHENVAVETEINWNNVDDRKIMLRKNIAKYMHHVRPSVSFDIVLMYAKGDYLCSAIPTLNTVLYNMSCDIASEYITKILEAPVSLQKRAIPAIMRKVKIQDLKETVINLWNNFENSIKILLFHQTFKLLCNEKNNDSIKGLWELFTIYIDSWSSGEKCFFYNIFAKLKHVPIVIRPLFFMKGFLYLKSFQSKSDCENIIKLFYDEATTLIDELEPSFVEDVLLGSLEANFLNKNWNHPKECDILASYILSCKTEETQMLIYEKFLLPVLRKSFRPRDLPYRSKINSVILDLIKNLTYRTASNQNIVPHQLFKAIRSELTDALPKEDNYGILLTWNFATLFVELVDTYVKDNPQIYIEDEEPLIQETANWICSNIMPFGFIKDNNKLWKNICQELAVPFGKACSKYLKEDALFNQYPTLYTCIIDVLRNTIFCNLDFEDKSKINFLKAMVTDNDSTYINCIVINYMPFLNFYDDKPLQKELLKILRSNASTELKIHIRHYEDSHSSDLESDYDADGN